MRIIKLESQNVKRLTAVEITPEGNMVVIGGRNGQGKTSVLDSITYALAGTRAICDEPIHRGESKAKIVCTLDDLVVTRTFSQKGGGQLTVTSPDHSAKYSSPQKMLDKLVGKLTFDPLAFCQMKPLDQLEALRALVGIDFGDLDTKRKALYEQRAEAGRDVKGRQTQIEAMPFHEDTADKEVSVSELAEQLTEISRFKAAQDAKARKIGDYKDDLKWSDAKVADCEERVKRAEAALAEAKQVLQSQKETRDKVAAETAALPKPEAKKDDAPIRVAISTIEQDNAKVRDNKARAAMEKQFKEAKATYDSLTLEIEAIDKEKAERLQKTKFPVDGLSLTDDGVLMNGLPFDQASSAEQLRISVGMGIAMNPELKVLLIRDGSLLDEDSLKMVAQMAEANDAQVWLEKVTSTGEGCSVVIEDGQVKE
jgi:DNA repair exonuclease SbcCD ATPase subunit